MRLPESFSGGQLIAIDGGLTNTSYQLQLPRGDFFLRVSTPWASRLGVARGRELVLHKLAAEQGLAPRLQYMDLDAGLLITDWVTPAASLPDWHSDAGIAQLAELVARVHALPAPALVLDLESHLRFYLARICHRDPRVTKLFHRMMTLLQSLPPIERVFCHNDISPANVLGTPLLLVDWEYAGVGDPAFDLACLIRSFALDELQARQLWHLYQQRGRVCPWERIAEMLKVADFVTVLWANVFWECSLDARYHELFELQLTRLCRQEGLSS
jgi:thiamine kinase